MQPIPTGPILRTVFLDFEASSLGKRGWPVEVGWAEADGGEESLLIRPAPDWVDWSAKAEAIHGLSRATLERDGSPHDVVARRLVERLTGAAIYASAPSWDGKWLSVLLRAAGLPRHALRLDDTSVAHRRAVGAAFAPRVPSHAEREEATRRVVEEAERRTGYREAPAHRALADAKRELALWTVVRRLAPAMVRGDAWP